jgi:hypothetical protein
MGGDVPSLSRKSMREPAIRGVRRELERHLARPSPHKVKMLRRADSERLVRVHDLGETAGRPLADRADVLTRRAAHRAGDR